MSLGPLGQLNDIQGTPQAIASAKTNPKPSALEVNKNIEDFKYSSTIFLVGSCIIKLLYKFSFFILSTIAS